MITYKKGNIAIPIAIVIAGAFIAVAIYMSGKESASPTLSATNPTEKAQIQNNLIEREITDILALKEGEHILGNPSAPVKIIEYSDTECPYCKTFHETMQEVMDTYGKEGQVAWIYRHFPLSIHPKAQKEAEATECVAQLGGNDKFWEYLDTIFVTTPSNNQLDPALLPKMAKDIGINEKDFQNCLDKGDYASMIAQSARDAATLGAQGTPFSVIMSTDDRVAPLPGAYSYTQMKSAIDALLQAEKAAQ